MRARQQQPALPQLYPYPYPYPYPYQVMLVCYGKSSRPCLTSISAVPLLDARTLTLTPDPNPNPSRCSTL